MDRFATVDNRDLGAFIPAELDDMGLDPYAFRVYCRLCRRAGGGHAFESAPAMAEACKMSERKVRECLKALEAMGLIIAQERPGQTTVFRLQSIRTPASPAAPNPGTACTSAPPAGDLGTTCRTTPAPPADKGYPSEGTPTKGRRTTSCFVSPSVSEVAEHMTKRGVIHDAWGEAEAFVAHHENRDWMLSNGGKVQKMKDWRLAVVTWERRYLNRGPGIPLRVEEGGRARITGVKVPS